jgi:hypothetical protein
MVTTALTTSDTITVTCSLSVVARAAVAQWWSGSTGVLGDTTTSAAGSSATLSLASGTAEDGELVVGVVGIEDVTAPGYDSDTTNGAWSSGYGIGTTGGGAASNVYAAIQYKIVTGAGTQTWNLTHPTTDRRADRPPRRSANRPACSGVGNAAACAACSPAQKSQRRSVARPALAPATMADSLSSGSTPVPSV